jgi:hypothetical protein
MGLPILAGLGNVGVVASGLFRLGFSHGNSAFRYTGSINLFFKDITRKFLRLSSLSLGPDA